VLKPAQRRLVIATHNKGKLGEMAALLAPHGFECVSAGELGLHEPEETGGSFTANAELKAFAAAKGSGHLALADDSGLCVEALDDRPGIHSARWADPTGGPKGGGGRNFRRAMERVNRELGASLGASQDRRAYFVSVLALAWPDGRVKSFEGRVHGTLVWPPRGERGFGYDPMFLPDGYRETFGEMDPALKHRISHRAAAFRKLVEAGFR
jgi:XTP/dITP diphosphohydrolase